MRDLRYATRTLRSQPGFAAAALLMLALGIGATTAIFGVVNAVLIRPLPFPDPDSVINVVHTVNGSDLAYFSDVVYLAYADHNRSFDAFGVWAAGTATVTGGRAPEQVRTLVVSHEVLPALGMRPEIGRWFSSRDGGAAAPTVLLTHAFWQRRLGGDGSVLERTLVADGRQHQIIGVMPAAFRFGGEPDVILPQRIVPPGSRAFGHRGVARLKPGVTLAQANADVGRMIPLWFRGGPNGSRFAPALRPLEQDIVGDAGRTLWILLGTIGIVLLMACANVANLQLVRGDARRHELAIRTALGAPRMRIARMLLAESLCLAAAGGALGVGVAYAGLRLLLALAPADIPRLAEVSIDATVLGFAVAVSLASGVFFGLFPILKIATHRLDSAIQSFGRGATASRDRHRAQNVLVAVQMALALVLLVSSGLMIRSFQALRAVDSGFAAPQDVQTFSLFVPAGSGEAPLEGGAATAADERLLPLQHRIVERLAALPGVASAAFTSYLPMDPDTSTRASDAWEGSDGRNPRTHVSRQVRFISPGLFRALGIPLVAGADITWGDLHDNRSVALVSENLARELWGSAAAALGKGIRQGDKGSWYSIVGVARDTRDNGVDQPEPAMIFLPARHHANIFSLPGYLARQVTMVVRSERAGTAGFVEDVHEAVWAVDPALPLAKVQTFGDVYDRSMARTTTTLVLLAIAGAMALLLSVCGIYGVIAYAVSLRRREIGVRLALGARAADVRGLFVRRGLTLAAAGLGLGLAAAAGFTQLMRALLFGVSPLDPVTFAAVPVVLAVAALLASYLPARRAAAVDPVETIRAE